MKKADYSNLSEETLGKLIRAHQLMGELRELLGKTPLTDELSEDPTSIPRLRSVGEDPLVQELFALQDPLKWIRDHMQGKLVQANQDWYAETYIWPPALELKLK